VSCENGRVKKGGGYDGKLWSKKNVTSSNLIRTSSVGKKKTTKVRWVDGEEGRFWRRGV